MTLIETDRGQKVIDASDILIIDIYMIDSIQIVVGSGVGLVGVAGGCGWVWAGGCGW